MRASLQMIPLCGLDCVYIEPKHQPDFMEISVPACRLLIVYAYVYQQTRTASHTRIHCLHWEDNLHKHATNRHARGLHHALNPRTMHTHRCTNPRESTLNAHHQIVVLERRVRITSQSVAQHVRAVAKP